MMYSMGTHCLEEEPMPRHDDNHAPPDVDAAITIVFLIVLVAVLLFLAGATRPYMLG